MRRSDKRGRLVFGALVVMLFFVSWYPFRLDLPYRIANDVEQIPGALVFGGQGGKGLARTTQPPAWLAEAITRSRFDLHLVAQSLDPAQYGPAAVFSVSANEWEANVFVGQQGDDLYIRFRRPGTGVEGLPPFIVPGLFADQRAHDIRLVVTDGRAEVRVDGDRTVTEEVGRDSFASWNPTYEAALGNEPVGTFPWTGIISTAIVQGGETKEDLLAPGALELPAEWLQVPERLRNPPFLGPRSEYVHLVLHVLVFAVLGWLACVQLGWRWRRVVLMVAMLSVTLQLGKAVIVGRHPSRTDAVLQVASAGLGACVAGSRMARASMRNPGPRHASHGG